MARHMLSDFAVRSAKPRDKPYRLFDGDGLALLVSPTGVKSWQFRYRHDGKEQTATLGKLSPSLTLAAARIEAEKRRPLVAVGEHLTVVKRVAKAANVASNAKTFKVIAAAWMKSEAKRKQWSAGHIEQVRQSIENDLSDLDGLPISSIRASITAPILHGIETRAPQMEEKVARRLNAIMDFAVELGAIEVNPLPRRRRAKVERRHYAAVVDLPGIGEILRKARAADPCKGIKRADLLIAFTAQRVGEVVGARWDEFELDGAEVPVGDGHHTKFDAKAGTWSIPRVRMKMRNEERGPHVIPLPPQLLAMLREWRTVDNKASEFVCPAPRDNSKPITPEAVEAHYRIALDLAGKHSPHSWRSSFSTVCREAGKDSDTIEAQLDHVVGTRVAGAYDRSRRLALRRELLRWYEVTLIAARDGARVVALAPKRGRK